MSDELLKKIQALSTEEQLDLIEKIWQGIADHDLDVGLSEEWEAELARRLDDLEMNPQNTVTWEEIKARLAERQR